MIPASLNHSGTKTEKKKQAVEQFSQPLQTHEFSVVLCTSSFSLGLDLADIEYVVHYGVPNTVTDFIKETGSASREKTTHGHAVLLTHENMGAGRPIERATKEFYKTSNCRRKIPMAEFGIQPAASDMCCDACAWHISSSCAIIPYITSSEVVSLQVDKTETASQSSPSVTTTVSTATTTTLSDLSD